MFRWTLKSLSAVVFGTDEEKESEHVDPNVDERGTGSSSVSSGSDWVFLDSRGEEERIKLSNKSDDHRNTSFFESSEPEVDAWKLKFDMAKKLKSLKSTVDARDFESHYAGNRAKDASDPCYTDDFYTKKYLRLKSYRSKFKNRGKQRSRFHEGNWNRSKPRVLKEEIRKFRWESACNVAEMTDIHVVPHRRRPSTSDKVER